MLLCKNVLSNDTLRPRNDHEYWQISICRDTVSLVGCAIFHGGKGVQPLFDIDFMNLPPYASGLNSMIKSIKVECSILEC